MDDGIAGVGIRTRISNQRSILMVGVTSANVIAGGVGMENVGGRNTSEQS